MRGSIVGDRRAATIIRRDIFLLAELRAQELFEVSFDGCAQVVGLIYGATEGDERFRRPFYPISSGKGR